MKHIKQIVWDWNGTLLNDTEACSQALNSMMMKRNMGPVTLDDYRAKIAFPIRNLYVEAGFDFEKESYEAMCQEYIELYKNNLAQVSVHSDADHWLGKMKANGIKQFIVSASEYEILKYQLNGYGLLGYFDLVFGQDNHHGDSKEHLAEQLVTTTGIDPSETLFIGDTTHDYEVAQSAGFNCALVANGHCNKERLQETGAPVFNSITDVFNTLVIGE